MVPAKPQSSAPKAKHCWFQFRLLTLLVIVTAASVWLAWQFHRAEQQVSAVASIKEMGGSIKTEPRHPKWFWGLFGPRFDHIVIHVEIPLAKVQATVPCLRALPDLRVADINAPCTWEPIQEQVSTAEKLLRQSFAQVEVRSWFPLATPAMREIVIVEEPEEESLPD